MKECEEFAPLLSAFVDGELTEEERAEVLAHVSECEKCRRLLGELTALHAALGELEDEDVPAGFTEGVMAAVRAEKAAKKPQTKKRSAWRRWMPMAACAAIVALAAAVTIPRTAMKQEANDAAPAAPAAQEDQAMFSMAAPSDPLPDTDAEVEYPEQRCETVQSSPYYDRLLGSAAGGATSDEAKSADAPTAAENGSSEPEYYCETAPIGESGEEGSLLTAWYGPVVLELYGAGATDYVTENGGVKADDAGAYYVPIGALRALPEGLSMTDAQAEALTLAPAGAEWVLVYPNDDSEVPQP